MMEPLLPVYTSLCFTVLVSDSWCQSQADSVIHSTTPPIASSLPMKQGIKNDMDLFCWGIDQPEKCGKLSLHNPVFNLTCNEGYISDVFDGPAMFTFHGNGTWTPRRPECKRFCKRLNSHSVDVNCHYAGKSIDCSNPLPVGTEARGRCKMGYLLTEEAGDETIMCNEYGQWSQDLMDCVTPACGRKNTTDLMSPWLVMIHWDDQVICYGTLISDHIVITSADCVDVQEDRILISLQTPQLTVRQIFKHPYYFGAETNYAFNIALMDVETSIAVTPACVDWGLQFKISPGERGTVSANNDYWDIVNYVEFTYVDYVTCVSKMATENRRYLTGCKLCSTSPRHIDTTDIFGKGLVFQLNGVHYLKGLFIRWTFSGNENIYLAMNLSDIRLLYWLNETKQLIDAVHNNK